MLSQAGISKLTNKPAENAVLCFLIKDLTLLCDEQVLITPDMFVDDRNKCIFNVLVTNFHKGVTSFTDVTLKTEMEMFGYSHLIDDSFKQMFHWNENNDKALFYSNIERLQTLNTLRALNENFNIYPFFNRDFPSPDGETIVEQNSETIINHFMNLLNQAEDKLLTNKGQTQTAAKGVRELLQEFKQTPEVGAPMDGDIYNYAVRGARFGKFYINSADSGAGKTRSMIGQACSLAFPTLNKDGDIVVRDNGYQSVLYMAVEQPPDEIQTMILAYISGVSEDKILESITTPSEDKLLEKAASIMEKYEKNFIIEWMPDPTIKSVRAKILGHILRNNIHYVFYDYISSTPGLLAEFRDIKIREDVALMLLSNALKELSIKYNIFIQTSTQVNAESLKTLIRGASNLRGSRAIADKVDVGCISCLITKEEKEAAQHIIDAIVAQYGIEPNIVMDVYKNRRGKINKAKIFRYFDYGVCKMRDLAITDNNYNLMSNSEITKFEVPTTIYSNLEDIKEEDYD